MASSKRERELARMRAERQAARRAAASARRRQRNAVLGAVAGVLVVVVIAVGVFLATRSKDKAPTDTLAKAPSASPSVSPSAVSLAPGTCSYAKSGTAAKPLKLLPPTTGVETVKPFTAYLTTSRGNVTLDLSTAKAPCTVNSFRALEAAGFFDKTPCHRLTTQGIYVLQCGDPTGSGSGGPGYAFADENLRGATYPRGTVAMANSGAGTNGSQFFLVYKDSQLPPKYTPFGKITKGLDVLDKVAAGGSTPAGDGKPKLSVEIVKVSSKPPAA